MDLSWCLVYIVLAVGLVRGKVASEDKKRELASADTLAALKPRMRCSPDGTVVVYDPSQGWLVMELKKNTTVPSKLRLPKCLKCPVCAVGKNCPSCAPRKLGTPCKKTACLAGATWPPEKSDGKGLNAKCFGCLGDLALNVARIGVSTVYNLLNCGSSNNQGPARCGQRQQCAYQHPPRPPPPPPPPPPPQQYGCRPNTICIQIQS